VLETDWVVVVRPGGPLLWARQRDAVLARKQACPPFLCAATCEDTYEVLHQYRGVLFVTIGFEVFDRSCQEVLRQLIAPKKCESSCPQSFNLGPVRARCADTSSSQKPIGMRRKAQCFRAPLWRGGPG